MRFKYKATTKDGKARKGTIEASSYKAALYVLEKYGLFVISLKEAGKETVLNKNISFRRISEKDITFFTRQLAVMLRSGISPVEALRAQISQTNNPDFRQKILTIAEKIEGGSSLSQAFSFFPKVFNQFYISVIRSGEATGKVAESLSYLSKHLEQDYNFKRKIKGAMIYPVFVIFVFIGVIFLASFFIMPKLTDIFTSFGNNLPFVTRATITLSGFIRKGGWILLLAIIPIILFLPRFLKKSKKAKAFFDKAILKIPFINELEKKIYLTTFAENLSVLISAGLPITQALGIIEGIINNGVYKKIIAETAEKVAKGERISSVFSRYPDYVPSFVTQMVSTGEDTGRLDEILMDIVTFYRQEVERTTDNLTNILEPLLILVLGIGVAVLAVSVFIPLFNVGMGGMSF